MNPIYRIKKRFRLSKRSKSFRLNIDRTLMQLHHRIENNHREIATSHQSFVMTRDRLQGLIICFIGAGAFVVLNIVPVWGDYFFNCGELVYAARLAASAQHALLDGDFPLQYANDYDITLRPIFLYYTPTYYGIAGLTQIITGLEPYRVMLILIAVMALSATCGTYFTTRLLGGGPVMSGLAAAMLPISPYFMTDVFARGAFAVLSAWAVFPWMAYCFIKVCCRPQLQSGLLFILTTGLLIICLKIFFPWAVIWLALLGLFLFGFRRILALSPLFILCGSAALGLTAPYWANAMLLGTSLNIVNMNDVAFWSLTANLGVFSPLSYLNPLVGGYKHFNLQLGPLIVLSAVASLFYLRNDQIRALVLTTAVIALFVCSFFNAFPFWEYLPVALLSIQFPYRLLMFATTFGTIAAGLVLTAVARDSRVYPYGTFCAALALLFASFWWRVDISHTHVSQFYNVDFANTGDAYFENDGPKPAVLNQAPLPPSLINSSPNGFTPPISTIHRPSSPLPVQYSRRLTTLINGKPIDISNSNGLVYVV